MNKTMVISIILGLLMIVMLCGIASAVYYELKGEAICSELGYEMGGGNKQHVNCYRLVIVEWEE